MKKLCIDRVWYVVWMMLATMTTAAAAAEDKKDGIVELFNGKDLAGWKVKGDEGGFWKVGTAFTRSRGSAPIGR